MTAAPRKPLQPPATTRLVARQAKKNADREARLNQYLAAAPDLMASNRPPAAAPSVGVPHPPQRRSACFGLYDARRRDCDLSVAGKTPLAIPASVHRTRSRRSSDSFSGRPFVRSLGRSSARPSIDHLVDRPLRLVLGPPLNPPIDFVSPLRCAFPSAASPARPSAQSAHRLRLTAALRFSFRPPDRLRRTSAPSCDWSWRSK